MTNPPASWPAPDNEPEGEGRRGESGSEIRSELFSDGFPIFGLRPHGTLDPAVFIGKEFGGYKIVRLLGEGGMSWVFEANQPVINKPIALKICKPGTDQRLEAEANMLKDIRHPGIAQIHAGGRLEAPIGQLTYIVTELVPGARHLDDYCSRSLPNLRCRVELFATICDAVGHAHAYHKLIHRDLKPSNILVDADGRPKVIDFGIARSAVGGSDERMKHTVVGTPDYMSPEQRRGTGISPASDIYSLGLILQALVSDESMIESPPGRRTARTEGNPTSKPPRGLQRIIDRCLNLDPARRYADAGQLAQAVRFWLRWHLADWLDAWRAVWPTAAYRWLAERRRTILWSGLGAAFGAAAIWAVFVRPDMRSYAKAVAVAAKTAASESSSDGARAIADAGRAWRFARPFASFPPLELVCLETLFSGRSQGSLVANSAKEMVFRSRPDPLAAIGYAGGVALVDVSGPAAGLIRRLGNPAPISALAFSADGTQLIAGDEAGRVLIWDQSQLTGGRLDTTPRRITLSAPNPSAVLAISVLPGPAHAGNWSLALDAGGGLNRIDLPADGEDPRTTLLANCPGARGIALLESGRLLAIATDSGRVEFRDPAQPERIFRSDHVGEGPLDLAHDAAGRVLYAVTPRRLLVWRNASSTPPTGTDLAPEWEGTSPRMALADADACLIARKAGDQASLHCFRDIRSRRDTMPVWRETLTLTSPANIQEAVLIPGRPPKFTMLDDRGYLTTSR